MQIGASYEIQETTIVEDALFVENQVKLLSTATQIRSRRGVVFSVKLECQFLQWQEVHRLRRKSQSFISDRRLFKENSVTVWPNLELRSLRRLLIQGRVHLFVCLLRILMKELTIEDQVLLFILQQSPIMHFALAKGQCP